MLKFVKNFNSSAPGPPQMPTMSVMPQQQQIPQQMPPMQQQQQYPIYATGTSMNNHPNQQNGGPPIYVPSSISIQNSLNSVATAVKPSPAVPLPPSSNGMNNGNNSNYGHGQMIQQMPPQIPQAPQYMPTLQQQVSVPAAPVPPPPPAFQNNVPCPPPIQNIAQVAPNNASAGSGPALSGAPPPPPPPPMAKPGGMDMGSLAAQLQQAKLRKTSGPPPPPAENSGNSTSSSGSGNYGTIGRTSGAGEMASMMDEMAKTLARRRERQKDTTVSYRQQCANCASINALNSHHLSQTQDGDESREKWEKSNTLPHKLSSSNSQTLPSSSSSNAASSLADSPQSRKRFGSASEETILKVCQKFFFFLYRIAHRTLIIRSSFATVTVRAADHLL